MGGCEDTWVELNEESNLLDHEYRREIGRLMEISLTVLKPTNRANLSHESSKVHSCHRYQECG